MTAAHDAHVAARFDETSARFKGEVAADDVRLLGVLRALGPLAGKRVLDLGCGKGRFAAHLIALGAEVVGLDVSAGMLGEASGLDRVRASASRLPFGPGVFDAVVAVEVIEHVGSVDATLAEARRVLKPGGVLAIVDKNAAALDARRPWLPAALVKFIDERRGLWMYPARGPVRERWFRPRGLARRLRCGFARIEVAYLLRPEEARRRVFRLLPRARLMVLWSARATDELAVTRTLVGPGPGGGTTS